jgi:hypothetical protein
MQTGIRILYHARLKLTTIRTGFGVGNSEIRSPFAISRPLNKFYCSVSLLNEGNTTTSPEVSINGTGDAALNSTNTTATTVSSTDNNGTNTKNTTRSEDEDSKEEDPANSKNATKSEDSKEEEPAPEPEDTVASEAQDRTYQSVLQGKKACPMIIYGSAPRNAPISRFYRVREVHGRVVIVESRMS